MVTKLLLNSNSCGHDGISSALLKNVADCRPISLPLSKVFSKSVHFDLVSQLKIVKKVPIFNSGDNTKLINYRPVSILLSISKILERLIYNQMMIFINKYSIFSS